MAEWTPPSYRLPHNGQTVEALDGAGRRVRRVYRDGKWLSDDESVYCYVAPVFWRPVEVASS